MELTLTEIDRYRLQNLRIARLVELLPPMSGLLISIVEQTLCIELPYGLLRVAAIAVGTNQIELYAEEQLLCRLSLESVESSNNTPPHITMTAVLERETITTEQPHVTSWKIIASNTGESEAEIKKRLHELGINFHWMESGDWGVMATKEYMEVIRNAPEMSERESKAYMAELYAKARAERANRPMGEEERLAYKADTVAIANSAAQIYGEGINGQMSEQDHWANLSRAARRMKRY